LSENCIYKNLKILKNKNLIYRIGANKNGYWEIRDNVIDNVRDKEINFDEIIKNIIKQIIDFIGLKRIGV